MHQLDSKELDFLEINDTAESSFDHVPGSVRTDWFGKLQNRIENGVRGFDPTAVVEDCAAAAKHGNNFSRSLIFASLKAAGMGPLLMCDKRS